MTVTGFLKRIICTSFLLIFFPYFGFAQLDDPIQKVIDDGPVDIIGSAHNSLETPAESSAGKEPQDSTGKEPQDSTGKEPQDSTGKEPQDQTIVSQPSSPEPTIKDPSPIVEETPDSTLKEHQPVLPDCPKDSAVSNCLTDDVISNIETINGIEPPFSNFYGFKRAHFNKTFQIRNVFSLHIKREWSYPKVLWFYIHANELDARETLFWAINNIGGYGLYIENKGHPLQRNIRFKVPSIGLVEMDPNRMFTQRGMSDSLKVLNRRAMSKRSRYNKIFNYTWVNISKPATRTILRYWNKKRPLIALHNNRMLTITDYLEFKEYEVHIADDQETGNFVFTTNKKHFDILKQNHINVVRQFKLAHDGSLSDYAFLKGLPYVNIETRVGNPEVQKKLVFWVTYLLFPSQFDSTQAKKDEIKKAEKSKPKPKKKRGKKPSKKKKR